jgi:hypothetical protein
MTATESGADQAATIRRGRRLVLAVALVALALKVLMAATTFGTKDIWHWQDFVAAVAHHGPVGIYGQTFQSSFYNHPPLVGYLLQFVHLAQEHGFTIQFTIRTLTSLADVVTAWLVFEILKRRSRITEAVFAGAAVAASPVLFVISGYHGNTDPLFVMLSLLAFYLLADRARPMSGGVAIGLAVGIKIVPVVVIPTLLVIVVMQGRRQLLRFAAGLSLTVAVTWLPALIGQGQAVREHVLGYAGSGVSQWGLSQLGHWAGDPFWSRFLVGSGRFPIVLLCAVAPAVLLNRRPTMAAEAVGLALAGFLFFTPAFGTQYLVWGVAASYLLSTRWATVFNVAAGALLLEVYTRWNGGLPWDLAKQWGLNRGEVVAALVVWACLGCVLALGVRRVMGSHTGDVGRPSQDQLATATE